MPRDWEAFYSAGGSIGIEPVFVVRYYAHLLPPGPFLDLAGGTGRNALFVARSGREVLLLERSRAAVAAARAAAGGLPLTARVWDLEKGLPEGLAGFAGVLMSYYVQRSLLPHFPALLVNGGLALVEGFGRAEAKRRGRAGSPHYWEEGELLLPPPGMRLLAGGEGAWGGRCRQWAVWQKVP